MKKCLSSILSFLFLVSVAGAAGYETDVSVYNELSAAYNSGFYPGAVQLADKLILNYPESAYIGSSLVMQGESLVHIYQFDRAAQVISAAMGTDIEKSLKNTCNYWMAKVYESRKDDDNALLSYFTYCNYAKESGKYYPQSILGAGRLYYRNGNYEKAVKPLEYVVQHGKKYGASEYIEALLKLVDSYNNSNQAKKSLQLYQHFNEPTIGKTNWFLLTEYAGDAYLKLGQYKKAYDLYCNVLGSGEKALAATALKKAYKVSSQHKKEVGDEPGAVLQKAQMTLADNPELLAEFWTRLGTDAYYDGEYQKSIQYFDEAERHCTPELFEYAALYRAEIAAGKNLTSERAAGAEKLLEQSQIIQKGMDSPKYVSDYYKLFAKYAAYQEHWDDVKKYCAMVNPSDEISDYYMALANYNTGDYVKTNSLLESGTSQLYALSLARLQKMKESANVFNTAEQKGQLSDEARLNYAKVLLLSGRYTESQLQCAKCGLPDAKYILGLAQFNTRSWPYAEESFAQYLKLVDRKNKDNEKSISYALFYQGYSQYRQGKYVDSYNNLAKFVQAYPKHELVWNAQMAAANSAVQNGKYEAAVAMTEGSIKSTGNNTANLEESVLLCAEIHCDNKNYEKALNLLEPYSKLNNTFGMKSLFRMAQIYETLNEIKDADQYYKSVYDGFAGEKLAEEALFRRGELFYSSKEYAFALNRFKEYTTKYPTGEFIPASMFYSADCYAQQGNERFAIMQNNSLIQKYPDSNYVYSATKNLIQLQRKSGNYKEALNLARTLLDKYSEQAKNDGMVEVAADLEQLASGKNEPVVAKETEFRKNGGINTPAGRKAGTELIALYAKSSATAGEAVKMAEQILPLQKQNLNQESYYAAQNAAFLGQVLSQQEKYSEAASVYLEAAQYYRMNNGCDEQAAGALYGAYDAFTASGLVGDANEIARNLRELYPDSSYTKSVKIK